MNLSFIAKMNNIIAHRGPNDEGFTVFDKDFRCTHHSGPDTHQNIKLPDVPLNNEKWSVALGHRRLSIIDLSITGHQPMQIGDYTITYNGEIYNYLELKKELEDIGHSFYSTSDTEVILRAWNEWGIDCLNRFNGMFAFCLVDSKAKRLFIVRDRFGIKPLYYTNTSGYFACCSEVKQLRLLPEYKFSLNSEIVFDYLNFGLVDHEEYGFEENILSVKPGHFIEYDLSTHKYKSQKWYIPNKRKEASNNREEFKQLLSQSVKLRLRSDVRVGSCLSGGLDSSSIVCIADKIAPKSSFNTVTSRSEISDYDEWDFAEKVIEQVDAQAHTCYPSFEKLQIDFDKLLYHMDYPFGSTSQFSQWCVFETAQEEKITVMLDGQGADELLAGYGGSDGPLYRGYIRKLKLGKLISEIRHYKKNTGLWPKGFILSGLLTILPKKALKHIPDKYNNLTTSIPIWSKGKGTDKDYPLSLSQHLAAQFYKSSLPALLRYEDRNSMAFSVESRVPFLDYNFVEFCQSMPEWELYSHGVRKKILRESMVGIIPIQVLNRTDKMGFVSAEELWMRNDKTGWFEDALKNSCDTLSDYVDKTLVLEQWSSFLNGLYPFTFEFWRIICIGKWIKQLNQG